MGGPPGPYHFLHAVAGQHLRASGGSALLDVPFVTRVLWHLDAVWQSELPREAIDVRDPVPAQVVWNTALTLALGSKFDLRLSVFNLADAPIRHASVAQTFPGDYDQPGRVGQVGVTVGS